MTLHLHRTDDTLWQVVPEREVEDEWITTPNPWGRGTICVRVSKSVAAASQEVSYEQLSNRFVEPLASSQRDLGLVTCIAGRIDRGISSHSPFWKAVSVALGREALDIPPFELCQETSLDLRGQDICDLCPIKHFKSLVKLNLSHTMVDSILPLADLEKLQHLDLSYTLVSDLSPLSRLSELQTLELNHTPLQSISDFNPLKLLKKLERVRIDSVPLSEVDWRELHSQRVLMHEKDKEVFKTDFEMYPDSTPY